MSTSYSKNIISIHNDLIKKIIVQKMSLQILAYTQIEPINKMMCINKINYS